MEWWKDWWDEHKPCNLSSDAECVAMRITAVQNRVQRNDPNVAAEYRNDVFRKITRCTRNGWSWCYAGENDFYKWPNTSAREYARGEVVAELLRNGFNCKKAVVTRVDTWVGFSFDSDGIECDLSTPLPTPVSSSE